MTLFKNNKILSLLLALVMVVSMFPVSALAAEAESTDTAEPALTWELDGGMLYIDGTGSPETFTSPDDQPWGSVREQVTEVYIEDCCGLTVENLAYWFSGCVNLNFAQIPATVSTIGYHAFFDCQSLVSVVLLHEATAPVFVQGAFVTNHPLEWKPDYDPRLHFTVISDTAMDAICDYDWGADNCPITAIKKSGTALKVSDMSPSAAAASSGTGYCSFCDTTCAYTLDYEQWTDICHCIRHWCSNCGLDQCGGANAGSHTYNSSGYCTLCGFYNTDYDQTPTVCSHTSTYTSWSGCNWYMYCINCGQLMNSGTTHGSTYTSWSGCNWYTYCINCGQLMNSGTTHGSTYTSWSGCYWYEYCFVCDALMDSGVSHSYVYGNWEYYSTTRHRRLGTCSSCGVTTYSYDNHSTTTKYSQYSSTQHSYGRYCSACGSYVGTVGYASHTFTYGSWQSYNGTQHRRLKTCSVCGYSTYEYGSHTLTSGAWASISDTQHQRTNSCSCRYSTTETGTHEDTDNDGVCDDCGYIMAHFSVTVPASLSLVVSKQGEVYAATNAAVVNNSTGAVEITGVSISTANGWMLAPYAANMADAKVDEKLIGFSLNGAATESNVNSETLSLIGDWSIAKGRNMPLVYDAVVSAMSEPVSEHVLTIVFVLDWAA